MCSFMLKLFEKQEKTNIQRPVVQREYTVMLSELTPIFNYSIYKGDKKKSQK